MALSDLNFGVIVSQAKAALYNHKCRLQSLMNIYLLESGFG